MTFLRFLAWAFYWMRLEIAALGQPNITCTVTRAAGRPWRATFGESSGEGAESWQAIRHLLEGREAREPLELSPEALAAVADELAEKHDAARELAELEAARANERADVAGLGDRVPAPTGSTVVASAGDVAHLLDVPTDELAGELRGETLGDADGDELALPEDIDAARRGF